MFAGSDLLFTGGSLLFTGSIPSQRNRYLIILTPRSSVLRPERVGAKARRTVVEGVNPSLGCDDAGEKEVKKPRTQKREPLGDLLCDVIRVSIILGEGALEYRPDARLMVIKVTASCYRSFLTLRCHVKTSFTVSEREWEREREGPRNHRCLYYGR